MDWAEKAVFFLNKCISGDFKSLLLYHVFSQLLHLFITNWDLCFNFPVPFGEKSRFSFAVTGLLGRIASTKTALLCNCQLNFVVDVNN
ncbi:MAG: hypothetical protein RSC41_06535 [Oscillospiraceae bacterium]